MKHTNKNNIQSVILNLIQDLQRLPLQLINNMRGRCQIKFGMTALYNNGGFTLIELLVVVLIIGVLTAVALPQYKLAVAKSRVSTILPTLRALYQAGEAYYLAHNEYPLNTNLLDINVPGNCVPVMAEADDGQVWKCGDYFMVDNSSYSVNASYCPKNNEIAENCFSTREFILQFNRLHIPEDADDNYIPGRIRCKALNDSALGVKICNQLNTH